MASNVDWLRYFPGRKPEQWSPVTGCRADFPCWERCWARAMSKRFWRGWGLDEGEPFKPTWHEDWLDRPERWRSPRVVFCCGLGDLFAEGVEDWMIEQVWHTICVCPQHLFVLLTKRPERMLRWFQVNKPCQWFPTCHTGWPANVIVGVSASTQADLDARLPVLLEVPAARRMVSLEPLLEEVRLTGHVAPGSLGMRERSYLCSSSRCEEFSICYGKHRSECGYSGLDWVVAGGESGQGARRDEAGWYRVLRDECRAAGVPFFLKQMCVDRKLVHVPELDGVRHVGVAEV